MLYLLKPFSFATFRAKLEQYADYRTGLAGRPTTWCRTRWTGSSAPCGQSAPAPLPKGMSAEPFRQVTGVLRDSSAALSATRWPRGGTSRVTARRYLEHLADLAWCPAAALRRLGSSRGRVPLAGRERASPNATMVR